MLDTQKFLVVERDGGLGVSSVRTIPLGTPIGPDARRIRIGGPAPVTPPPAVLSPSEFDRWRQ